MDTRFIICNVPDTLIRNIGLFYNINSNIKFNKGDIVCIKLKISFEVEDGPAQNGNGILYHLEDIKNFKYFETIVHYVKYIIDENNIIQIVNVSLTDETINEILSYNIKKIYRKTNVKFE